MTQPMIRIMAAVAALSIAGAAYARGPAPVSFSDVDTNGDGQVTQTELQALGAKRFEKIDADSDGFVTQAEIENAGKEKAAKRAERMIKHLDSDEDGKLSAEEMMKRGGKRGAKMFERADTDKNGSLSEEEYASAAKKMGKKRHKKPADSE